MGHSACYICREPGPYPGLKVRGAKNIFREARFLLLLYASIKKILDTTKFGGKAQKKFGWHCP